MKILNGSIRRIYISMILVVLILIVLTSFIAIKLIENKNKLVYQDNNFMVEIEPNINKTIKSLSDSEGLKEKSNKINITNNSDKEKKYQIRLTPLNNNEDDIRISLNNTIKNLSNYQKEDNYYILLEDNLKPSYSSIYDLRIFLSKNSSLNVLKVNFTLSVALLDD